MRQLLATAFIAILSSGLSTAFAAEQTIKLSVPGMSCASCPYMIKQAISKVDGIKLVDATMVDRTATVTFEDTVTTVQEISQATANIGYPSTLIDENTGS